MSVNPYKGSADSKKRQVEQMFDNISGKYDFLNHFLSFSLDRLWRKRAISYLKGRPVNNLLDVATGTGDMAFAALKLLPEEITGIDISEGMLTIAREKVTRLKGDIKMNFIKGDSEALPFRDESFDAATVAFGVRNFENIVKGLSEINRVLRPGAKLVVLEFSKPDKFPVSNIYQFYFKNLLPLFGRFISKDREAYTYLPESVNQFPEKEDFVHLLHLAGFSECSYKRLTFGVVTVYQGIK
jgi:demethylmenaquinone methyltransferase / 2-methoxy-6-polyprenyl-1,4-benzoquinol methylase